MLNQANPAALRAFVELHKTDPEKFKEILLANPKVFEELQELNRRYVAAESVSLAGFQTFYRYIYLREMPPAAIPIVREFVWAYENKKGVMEECWRGFGKSTLLIAWVAYLIGARPVGSSTFIRINEKAAQKSGGAIAELIETNPGWKDIFPHVVPDKEAGWSAENGWHVKDMTYIKANSYEKWLQLCFADHTSEPSLACGGVSSGIIIGTHPSNGCWIDDLHDESNTRSRAEMEEVVAILKGNIISTWFGIGGSPAIGVACTPWNEKDAYAEMMKTGLFKKVSIPMFVREGQIPPEHPAREIWEKNAAKHTVYFEPYACNVILTDPKHFGLEKVLEIYYANPARFGQMALLDLSTLKGLTLKKETLGEFPLDKILSTWPCYFGVDFASTTDKIKGDSDRFALAIGRAIPGGGVVVIGGYVGRLTLKEALSKLQSLYELYHPLIIGIEKHGSGKDFIDAVDLVSQLMQATELPIIPYPLQGAPVKSKGQKFEGVLDSLFAQGRMWLSELHDEFINTVVDQWISWDGTLQKSRTGHDDALDSLYILSLAAQGQVMQAPAPGVRQHVKRKSQGLMSGLNAHKGY